MISARRGINDSRCLEYLLMYIFLFYWGAAKTISVVGYRQSQVHFDNQKEGPFTILSYKTIAVLGPKFASSVLKVFATHTLLRYYRGNATFFY